MIKFSEFVSLGHPDKIADYISQYILDRYIERDPKTRYAVEVQIKGAQVTLGGEVTSLATFSHEELTRFTQEAVNEIGYTREYMDKWGADNTICGDILQVTSHISQQSADIAQGLEGWGDQGIFFGYSDNNPLTFGMPTDHTIAKRLCKLLFDSKLGGLDIKTQIVTDFENIKKVIVAIPLLNDSDKEAVAQFVRFNIPGEYDLIINGTGRYVKHSTIADCGTTGRKLAVDFYGGNCLLGGGSPWTKDGSKADLTLNLFARKMANRYAEELHTPITISLACCIGKSMVDVVVKDMSGEVIQTGEEKIDPQQLIADFKLDTPIYASMCRWGLFGEYQQDKEWER